VGRWGIPSSNIRDTIDTAIGVYLPVADMALPRRAPLEGEKNALCIDVGVGLRLKATGYLAIARGQWHALKFNKGDFDRILLDTVRDECPLVLAAEA